MFDYVRVPDRLGQKEMILESPRLMFSGSLADIMAPTPADYFSASSFDTYVPISRQQSIWQTTGCLSMILGEEPSHGTC